MTWCWLPSCLQQSSGSRWRVKTWRRTETWRTNIGARQFLIFFYKNGRDYSTLSFAEKSRVLYWSIKRIIKRSCFVVDPFACDKCYSFFFSFSRCTCRNCDKLKRLLFWGKKIINCQNVFNVRWKSKYFFRPRFPPSTTCFRQLPRQLTPSNYFITSKFSRAVYFFKLLVISNVGMICN